MWIWIWDRLRAGQNSKRKRYSAEAVSAPLAKAREKMIAEWRSVCREAQGRGHRKMQLPCQDKTCSLSENGVNVIALADGAGSERFSHYGAERVVRCVTALLVSRFQEYFECDDGRQVKKQIVAELMRELANEAERQCCEVRALAATLLFAAVKGDGFILGHIGDGVLGYLEGAELKVASAPDNGEFSNVTTFVTSAKALSSMRLYKGCINDISAFVLMSDGSGQSLYNNRNGTLAKGVKRLMYRTCLLNRDVMEEQLGKVLSSALVKNTQDDCSVAILARPVGQLIPFEKLSLLGRMRLYEIPSDARNARKRAERFDEILRLLGDGPCSLSRIAKKIHLPEKHTVKRMGSLEKIALVKKIRGVFTSCINEARYES